MSAVLPASPGARLEAAAAAEAGVQVQMPPPAARRTPLAIAHWTGIVLALAAICVLVPVLNLVVPAGSAFHLSDYAVQLIAKILC